HVEQRVGSPAAVIRRLASEFCDADRAVCYGRMGTCTHAFGTTASWLIEVLNAITGNLDRAGGAMFPNPAVDVAALQPATQRGRWHSRTRGTPEFMGELPTSTLAEEINTPGEGQVRALVTLAGNPALSSPAGHRLAEALSDLEFMVSIDFYLNETTQYADVILPPVSPLEREHYDVVFQLFAVQNVPHWSPRAFEPKDNAPSDGEILLKLAQKVSSARSWRGKLLSLLHRAGLAIGAERLARTLLDLALRSGPHGNRFLPWRRGLTLAKLRRSPHGIDLGKMQPSLHERLPRDEVDLAPRELLADHERLLESLRGEQHSFTLIGRRETRTINSWSHNLPSFVKGPERCLLEIHPSDLETLELRDGAQVRVSSRVGSVEVPVRASSAMMPGVVCLPHGYGHGGQGVRLRVAAQHAGGSLNDLTDPAEIDPFSGNAVLNGIPVQLAAVAPVR
ncbi:MAG: molybdopterin-dependent oxidoreductase, partial [bacterium]|nr:molybdopterin-dependent oxidoreductase [bacterium]